MEIFLVSKLYEAGVEKSLEVVDSLELGRSAQIVEENSKMEAYKEYM